MPQMSPLGWAWMIFFVVLGYFLFFSLFFYVFECFVSFTGMKIKLNYFLLWW